MKLSLRLPLSLLLCGIVCTAANVCAQQQRTEPFGFKMGMTKAEVIAAVGAKSVQRDTGDTLKLTRAPNSQSDFEFYLVTISSNSGVAKVSGITKDIKTNASGESLQEKFKEFQAAIENKYGKATQMYDFVDAGSMWKSPQDWMMGLLKNDRNLLASWDFNQGASISEKAEASASDVGWIIVQYEFSNFESWQQEYAQKNSGLFK
jgi:hypothetical protein